MISRQEYTSFAEFSERGCELLPGLPYFSRHEQSTADTFLGLGKVVAALSRYT